MPTDKQIAANRRNAQLSTGPRTPQGRAISRLNAYKHGLTGHLDVMTDEQQQARDAFIAELAGDLKPVGAFELHLAHSIAETQWRIRRVSVIENNIFTADAFNQELDRAAELAARAERICRATDSEITAEAEQALSAEPSESDDADTDSAFASARTFIKNPERFNLLTVYEMRLHRKFQSELRQLRDIQSARAAEAERRRTEAERQKAAAEKQKADHEARRTAALQESAWLLNLDEEEGKTIEPDGVFRHRNGFVFSNATIREGIDYATRLATAKALFSRQTAEIARQVAA